MDDQQTVKIVEEEQPVEWTMTETQTLDDATGVLNVDAVRSGCKYVCCSCG